MFNEILVTEIWARVELTLNQSMWHSPSCIFQKQWCMVSTTRTRECRRMLPKNTLVIKTMKIVYLIKEHLCILWRLCDHLKSSAYFWYSEILYKLCSTGCNNARMNNRNYFLSLFWMFRQACFALSSLNNDK